MRGDDFGGRWSLGKGGERSRVQMQRDKCEKGACILIWRQERCQGAGLIWLESLEEDDFCEAGITASAESKG